MKTVFFGRQRRQVAPPTERLRLRQPEVGPLELQRAPFDGDFRDFPGKVAGDALPHLQPSQVRADAFVLQVDLPAETAVRHVAPHHRVQLGEAVGQTGALRDQVGDVRQQFPGRPRRRGQIVLVHLGLGGRELHLQADSVRLGQIFLLEDRVECGDVQLGELAEVVPQARPGDRNRDVVRQPFPHRFDDHRRRGSRAGARHADALGLQLLAEHPQQVARAEHLERLGPIRADSRHGPQSAADHLLGEDLRLRCVGPQAEHHRHVAHVPALAQHHHADDRLDPAAGPVDVPRRRPGPVEVALPHFPGVVGVDDEYANRRRVTSEAPA